MQGSFWKTVAVIGVIGIGSLAILEVQNGLRQPKQTAEQDAADANALAQQILAAGENTVNAPLQESDFDRFQTQENAALMADGGPQFNLSEPNPTDMAEASAFQDSVPIQPQDNTPPVDTAVDFARLSQGGNPFGEDALSETIAANYQGSGNDPVQPVGFAQESAFAPDPAAESDAVEQPKSFSGDPQPVPVPSENTEFLTFGGDEADVAQKPQTQTVPATTASNMKFFSGNEEPAAEPPQPQPSAANQPQPSATAQFFEADPADLQPTPDPASAVPFEADAAPFDVPDAEPFDGETTSPPDNAFQPFGDGFNEPVPAPNPQPAPLDLSDSAPVNTQPALRTNQPLPVEAEPFTEDMVPSPREPAPFGETSNPNDEISAPPERFNPGSSNNVQPMRSPQGDAGSSIPFVEDIDETDNNTSPGRDLESPGLNIPSGRDTYPFRDQPANTPDFSAEPPVDSDTMEVRPFPSGRAAEPIPEYNLPPRQPADGVREFNGGGSSLDRSDRIPGNSRPDFSIDGPEIGGRDFNSGGSRNTGIRRVSSEMRPNLVLQKSAPQNATVGTPLDYTITVRNEGDATAYDVVVEDDVTTAAEVEGARPQPQINRTTNKLIWSFEQIDPGDSKEITVRVVPTGEGTLDGVATVKFKTRVKATTVVTAPKLRLQMAGPDEVRLGDEVSYRYVITNEGSGEARNVFVRTVLPTGGGLKHPAGNDLEYEIRALKPNEQREIVLAVVAAEPGEHRAEAEVSAAGGAKDQAAWRTNVVGAQLKIVRRGPKRRFVGKPATYENIISNETNFDATDARIVEEVPAGMKFLAANLGGRYDDAARTVTWMINRIGAGRQETLQIELMPMQAGSPESIVRVYENAGITGDNHVSTTVVEDLHNVSADISQLDGPMAIGETFGFTITVDNRGTADATDVELSIAVPREIQVVGAGSRDVQARLLEGNVVQYNMVVRIPPEQQQAFELKLKGVRPVRNGLVEAKVHYTQMERPLVVSESVTIYQE